MREIYIAGSVIAAGLVIATASPVKAQTAVHTATEVTVVKPETVGFSSQRLDRLHALIQQEVDQKQLAGAVTILARHGKVVDYRTYGYRDIATSAPMTKDVIFRDSSMTKPVTGVAMMILYEQGKWLPPTHRKIHSGVRAAQSLPGGRCERQDDTCRSRPSSHHAGAYVALRRFLLWLRPYGGGRDVPRSESDGLGEPAGDDRQAGDDSLELSAGQGLDLQRLHGH